MTYPKTKTAPWAHQVSAWHRARTLTAFYAAMDMGTGKSKFFVDFCVGVDARLVLVVCPKKAMDVWPKQFETHCGIDFKIIIDDIASHNVRQKASYFRAEIARAKQLNQRVVVVINYDSLWRPGLGPAYEKKRIIDKGLFLSYSWDVIGLDEIHRIMSPGSSVSKFAWKLAACGKRRIGLSGTPFQSSPLNIFGQFRFLDDNIFGKSAYVFNHQYADYGGFENRQVMRFKNLEDLHRKFYSIAYRISKRDALPDLPPVIQERLECTLDPKTRHLYDELSNEFIVQFNNGEITVSNVLTKLLRLSQITGGFITMNDKNIQNIDTSKLEVLLDKIKDLPEDEPIVIFYRFTPEAALITKSLEQIGRAVKEVSGQKDQLKEWQNGSAQILLVQIQSGSDAIDLTRACYAFYYSKGMISHGKLDQSLSRLDRPGQTRNVTIYHLVAKATIDIKVEAALKARKKTIDYVLHELTNSMSFLSRKAVA